MFLFDGVCKSQVRFNDLQRYNLGKKSLYTVKVDAWRIWLFADTVTNSWSEVSTNGNLSCSRTFHRVVVAESQMYLLGGYDGTYWLRDIYSIELGFASTLYRLSISHDMHAGVLCPTSLVELYAASYANTTKEWNHRLHSSPYQRVQLHGKLIVSLLHMCLHADLLNHVVFRRDQTGVLRGKCNQCPDGRCDFYRHPRGKIPYPPQQSLEAAFECFCGHSNICHEAVDVSGTLYQLK